MIRIQHESEITMRLALILEFRKRIQYYIHRIYQTHSNSFTQANNKT